MTPTPRRRLKIFWSNSNLTPICGAHNFFKRFSKKQNTKTVYEHMDQHPPLPLLLATGGSSNNADEKEEADFEN